MSRPPAARRFPSTAAMAATSRWCDTEALFLPHPYSNAPASVTAIGRMVIHIHERIFDWTRLQVGHRTRKCSVGIWVGKISQALKE